jgi:hypothetical protein
VIHLSKGIKKREKFPKYQTKILWSEVYTAPINDREFQLSLHAMMYLLKDLFRFENIKKERAKIIPFEAFNEGARDPNAKLPTIDLIASSPLFPPYSKLQKSTIHCLYWGSGRFLFISTAKDLISDIGNLYSKIRECLKKRDYIGAQEIFNDYYGIKKIEPPQLEKRKEKLEIKEISKPAEIQKLEEKALQILEKPKEVSEKPKELEEEKTEKFEIPEYNEAMDNEIANYFKKEYDPKNFYEHVLPKLTYDVIMNMAWKKDTRQLATCLYYSYIQRGCKRDPLGDFLYKNLVKIRDELQSELNRPRRIKQAQ